MDWRTALITLALAFYADGYSKYGRTCKDIGCLNSQVCVLAEDPCSFGHTSDCGTYPTCKKKSQVEGSHAEPSAPKPTPPPARPQSHDFDSPPSYNPPAPPSGGNTYGGNSPYGGSSGGNSPYGGNTGGGSPYGSPYGSNSGGGSPYGGGSTYGGGSPYGGNSNPGGSPYGNPYGGHASGGGSPYGTNGGGGGSPYGSNGGGGSPYGSNGGGGGSPYGSNGGGSPYGGSNPYGGSSNTGGLGGSGAKSPLDSILNTINKYANGGQGGQSGQGGSGFSNIFGNVLGNLSKNGLGGLLSNTRPIQENPNYSSYSSNSRSANTQTYPSGYQNQPPTQNRNYAQSHATHNGAVNSKPYSSYGWNASVTMIFTYFIHRYLRNVIP